MNIDDYISSGIIQRYVLGLATEEERSAFEKMVLQYPQLSEAKDILEKQLEQFALRKRENPPHAVKSQVMAGIDIDSVKRYNVIDIETQTNAGEEKADGKFAPNPRIFSGKNNALADHRMLAFLSTVLLLISVGLNFFYFTQTVRAKERYRTAMFYHEQAIADNDKLKQRILSYEKRIALENNEQVKKVFLTTEKSAVYNSDKTIIIYWDSVRKETCVMADFLSQADGDVRYHLWANENGEYAHIGKIVSDELSGPFKMENALSPSEFLLSIENIDNPSGLSLDKLLARGEVN